MLTQAWGTVFWRCWLTLNILFSILVEALNMSRLLSPIEENTATLHFCLGSGSPWGRKRTGFSTHRISRAIPTCIICNAQLPFTTYYCSTTEAWQCQGLWWLGRCRPQKFVFVSWAPKSYLTTWGQECLLLWFTGTRWESRGKKVDPFIFDYTDYSNSGFRLEKKFFVSHVSCQMEKLYVSTWKSNFNLIKSSLILLYSYLHILRCLGPYRAAGTSKTKEATRLQIAYK